MSDKIYTEQDVLIHKAEAVRYERQKWEETVQILRGALKMIIEEDDTGPMQFELRENGPSQAIGRGKGKFAKIASLAIASSKLTSDEILMHVMRMG